MEIFALIVLLVLIVSVLAIWAMLGMYPGKIAHARNHPQADAIAVCGWWGAITMGLLSPLAFIWAYTNPSASLTGQPTGNDADPEKNEPGKSGESAS